jgi:hypothetical protein
VGEILGGKYKIGTFPFFCILYKYLIFLDQKLGPPLKFIIYMFHHIDVSDLTNHDGLQILHHHQER